MIVCTFRVAWAGNTLPPVAVMATISNSGSNKAMVIATASSMPGSVSIITFLAMMSVILQRAGRGFLADIVGVGWGRKQANGELRNLEE